MKNRLVVCSFCQTRPDAALPDSRLSEPEAIFQTGHTGSVTSVAFSPDGRWLASSIEDGTVSLWDRETGLLWRTLGGYWESHHNVFKLPMNVV